MIGLPKYHNIQNLTKKMNTDHILSHHILTHPNSAIIHHFFHPFIKALPDFKFSSSTLYYRACLHIGQKIDIPIKNTTAMAIISHTILNLCIAFTKYIKASDTSIHVLYCIFTSQFIK